MTTIQHGTQMTLAEYRALDEAVDGVWELVDGVLEQMPPPTFDHQNLIDFLVSMINLFQLGLPTPIGWAVSGIGVALNERRAPTPDMVYLRAERAHLIQGSFVEGIPGSGQRRPDDIEYVRGGIYNDGILAAWRHINYALDSRFFALTGKSFQ